MGSFENRAMKFVGGVARFTEECMFGVWASIKKSVNKTTQSITEFSFQLIN